MDLQAGEIFSATLDGPCEISMYIFADCSSGVALVCADSGGSGGQEVIDFDEPGAGTYYLVLDTFQAAGCEVIVNTESSVAVNETSWSTVKTLFRKEWGRHSGDDEGPRGYPSGLSLCH